MFRASLTISVDPSLWPRWYLLSPDVIPVTLEADVEKVLWLVRAHTTQQNVIQYHSR